MRSVCDYYCMMMAKARFIKWFTRNWENAGGASSVRRKIGHDWQGRAEAEAKASIIWSTVSISFWCDFSFLFVFEIYTKECKSWKHWEYSTLKEMEHDFPDLNLKGRMRSNVQSQTWLYQLKSFFFPHMETVQLSPILTVS